MHYEQQLGYRYPKGRFALISVYSFTGAAILASTIFSLLLFLSIDDNPLMQALFGGLAIIFEAGKFYAWYEFGERRAHRNYSGAITAFVFYLVLAAISIGGSIGGINSATNTAQNHIALEQAKVTAFNRQIDAIEKQIELNNLAAQKYIEMERIATGVNRIQQQNDTLRKEQQKLAMQRDSLPPVAQGSVVGLIDSLAAAFSIPSGQAQLGLVVFLSVLLDFFAAFFVGVIGEEQRFRHWYRRFGDSAAEPVESVAPVGYLPHLNAQQDYPIAATKEAQPAPSPLYLDVAQALASNELSCSKKANNHYHWLGDTAAA
ncbi:TPA: Preprotein translocase subunit SecY [Vibrio vulnificus]